MPNFLSNDESIQGKWGPPPKLDAPNISGVLGEILQQRRWQQAQTQKALADTIRNVREERQSAEYLDAMKAAGLVPQDYDAGGMGGAKLGTGLAKMIEDKREADSLIAHRAAIESRLAARGSGRGGSGGGGGEPSTPQTVWDEQGREWRPGPGGRWIPIKPVGGTGSGEKPTDVSKAIKEQAGLLDTKDWHDKKIAEERAANIKLGAETKDPKYQNVPYSHSDVYNRTVNRLKQLETVPGMPSTQPQGVPQRPPAETGDAESTTHPRIQSDKAGGHAEGYGVPPVGTIRNGFRFKGGDPKLQENWEPTEPQV